MKPVKDWKQSYKWYSIWGAVATVLLAIVDISSSLLPIWQTVIDPEHYKFLIAGTGTLTIVARLIDQGEDKDDT